jgi:hypothetical protein
MKLLLPYFSYESNYDWFEGSSTLEDLKGSLKSNNIIIAQRLELLIELENYYRLYLREI